MKMVSQLTRQAMNRHRILSSGADAARFSPPPPPSPPTSPLPPAQEPVRPLYSSDFIMPPAADPARSASPVPSVPVSPPAPRPRGVYQQLMASHDRMTERHIRNT